MTKFNFNIIPLCVTYKVVKEFKQSENNSVSSIMKKFGYTYNEVNTSINRYLSSKIKNIKI